LNVKGEDEMTSGNRPGRVSLGADSLTPPFKPVSTIPGEGLELKLTDKFLYSNERIPGYEFLILVGGEEAGKFTALIEGDVEKVRDEGNVGIEINRKFYGRDLPASVVKALSPFFQEHGLTSILITCDKDSGAIHKACERLGAQYLDTVDAVEPSTQKERYILKL
jgi:hypothetical protein